MKALKQLAYRILNISYSILFLPIIYICACIVRYKGINVTRPRLVWGSTPILNNSYWARAMLKAGYESETFTIDYYSTINNRENWDKILSEQYKWIPLPIKSFVAFIHGLFLYDVYFISLNGFFIGDTYLRYYQAFLLKVARKKIVVIPYGSDAYVYKYIKSTSLSHGLLMSYPVPSRQQKKIERNLDYWIKNADVVVPGFMGPDGFGRWEVLTPSPLFIDIESWKPSTKLSNSDGKKTEIIIVHAPNHRGFKGTEFLVNAVERLKKEGFNVQLKLLERIQNQQVRDILAADADILVEQLIFTGHGLNGLEGLASGLPTISNLEDEAYTLPMRRWSYFSECPLVSATPENIVDVLRKLITQPELRHQIGNASREYVEKYHGLDSAQYLFQNVIDYVYGRKDSLINLYHPLLGDYPNRSPKIQHPLVNNRIVDL